MGTKQIFLEDDEIVRILSMLDGETSPSLQKILSKLEGKLKPPISTKSRKSKGAALQRLVATELAQALNVIFDNNNDSASVSTRPMGQKGTDIILRNDAADRFPFAIECKAEERFELLSTMRQAQRNMKGCQSWMIVLKNSALSEPVVMLNWRKFLDFSFRKEIS